MNKLEKFIGNTKTNLRIASLAFLIYGIPALGIHGCSMNKYLRENRLREHLPSAGIRTIENKKLILEYQDILKEKYFGKSKTMKK